MEFLHFAATLIWLERNVNAPWFSVNPCVRDKCLMLETQMLRTAFR